MKRISVFTLAAGLLVAAPFVVSAQTTPNAPSIGAIKTPVATVSTTPAATTVALTPKAGDKIKDVMNAKATPTAPGEMPSVEKTARVIEYKSKDKKDVKRTFLFHKNAEGKLMVVEYTKLDGTEVTPAPEALEWVLKSIGIAAEAKGPEVIGPDKKTYHMVENWHSANSSDLNSKDATGPHGEKLQDTDLYVKGEKGWAKHGAKPKVAKTTTAKKETPKPAATTKTK